MRVYEIGSVLPNKSVIVGGPQRFANKDGKSYVKWLVACPTCGDETWKFSNTFSKLKWGCKLCYDKSMRSYDETPAIKRAYISLKSNAKAAHRNYEVEITQDEFYEIAKQDCNYCGDPPVEKRGPKEWNPSIYLNGIDRVDNNKGYVKGNCVACCKQCNRAKDIMSVDEFYAWIDKVNKWKQH